MTLKSFLFSVLIYSWCLNASAIVGGEELRQGEFRQSVALVYKTSPEAPQGEVYCSGTLVGPKAIMTAAHCLSSGAKAFKLSQDEFITKTWIYIGDSPRVDSIPFVSPQYAVAKAHHHQQTSAMHTDFIMLVLSENVDLLKYEITPAPTTVATAEMLGAELTHVGFGMIENAGSKGAKRFFRLPILHINLYNGLGVGQRFADNPSACHGDSGGSAYVRDRQGAYVFVGIEQSISNHPCGKAATYFIPITDRIYQWMKETKEILF